MDDSLKGYIEEADRRCTEGLGLGGSWTYHAREELKERGFVWSASYKQWAAPNQEAKEQAVVDLRKKYTPKRGVVPYGYDGDYYDNPEECGLYYDAFLSDLGDRW